MDDEFIVWDGRKGNVPSCGIVRNVVRKNNRHVSVVRQLHPGGQLDLFVSVVVLIDLLIVRDYDGANSQVQRWGLPVSGIALAI